MMHDAPHAWTLAAKGPMTKHKGVYVCEEDLHKVCTSSQHCDPPPATHACVCVTLVVSKCVCVSHPLCASACEDNARTARVCCKQ